MITMIKIYYDFLCILACHPTLYDSACIVFISLAHSTTLPILGIYYYVQDRLLFFILSTHVGQYIYVNYSINFSIC